MIYKLDDEGLQVEQLVLIRPLGVGDTDTHHGINGPVIRYKLFLFTKVLYLIFNNYSFHRNQRGQRINRTFLVTCSCLPFILRNQYGGEDHVPTWSP